RTAHLLLPLDRVTSTRRGRSLHRAGKDEGSEHTPGRVSRSILREGKCAPQASLLPDRGWPRCGLPPEGPPDRAWPGGPPSRRVGEGPASAPPLGGEAPRHRSAEAGRRPPPGPACREAPH